MRRIGTQVRLDDDGRARLLSQLRYWHRIVADPSSAIARRKEYERAFYCIWNGQNASGVRKDTQTEQAWPFDGASDQRIRWGEEIFQNLMAYTLVAISQCEVEITCGGDAHSVERAAAMKRLLAGVEASLGAKGLAEIKAMFHYMFVDSPAVGALEVFWKKRRTIGVIDLNAEDLQAEYAATVQAAGGAETEAAMRFRLALNGELDAGDEEEIVSWLVTTKKVLREDAAEVLRALGTDGECECRALVDSSEGPELRALRYGEDFCLPAVTNDFDYASPWFRSEWMTEAQLRERVAEDGWDAEWAEETLGFRGYDFFNEWATAAFEEMKDLVNVVWCYEAETNDRGETTRYVSVLSHANGSAFGRRILRSRRGRWDTVLFRREVRNSNVIDGRGLAELCSPPQGVAKTIRDLAADNAIIGAVPPVKAKGSRMKNILIEPNNVIQMAQSDDLTYMQPPAFPAAADKQAETIKAELFRFFGVPYGDDLNTDRRMELTEWIIRQWRDFLVMLLETAQDNASPDYIARVTANGDVKGVRSEDVSGEFSLVLKLDPRNLDNKLLIEKMNATSQFLASMDRKGTVDTDPVVKHCFTMLFPEMAGTSFRSAEELTQDDIKAEQQNFVLIKSGVMPQMDTDGKWNYAARIGFWQQLQQENPDAIAEMSPRSQEMMNRWLQALQMQQTQFGENAQIGKTGVEGVGAN